MTLRRAIFALVLRRCQKHAFFISRSQMLCASGYSPGTLKFSRSWNLYLYDNRFTCPDIKWRIIGRIESTSDFCASEHRYFCRAPDLLAIYAQYQYHYTGHPHRTRIIGVQLLARSGNITASKRPAGRLHVVAAANVFHFQSTILLSLMTRAVASAPALMRDARQPSRCQALKPASFAAR